MCKRGERSSATLIWHIWERARAADRTIIHRARGSLARAIDQVAHCQLNVLREQPGTTKSISCMVALVINT